MAAMIVPRSFLSRMLPALAALMVFGAVASAAAPNASAETPLACKYDRGSNACLSFDWRGYGWLDAQVGIDVHVPDQYGREILACGPDFKAQLRGDDGKGANNPILRTLILKAGWPTTFSGGISAEFYGPNLSPELDEDRDGQDELYATISYYDCHTLQLVKFDTGVIKGEYRL
jgi:hypothetical protein